MVEVESAALDIQSIESRIYLMRGQRVMLSPDLAELYGVELRVLHQSMKRNQDRFPSDFVFQITNQDVTNLKSQFVISSWGGSRHLPYAFTEQGVAMLSSVLRSPQAVAVNIEIMRTFVRMRRFAETNKELAARLDELEERYDGQFRAVFEAIRELMAPSPKGTKRPIGFIQDK